MSKGSRDLYKGKAGEFAAMSEFLLQGYNVAMPEVDEGDDILLLRNQDGETRRVQVKTAVRNEGDEMGLFKIQRRQLITPIRPELCYVFAFRQEARWDFMVLERRILRDCIEQAGLMAEPAEDIFLRLRFLSESIMLVGARSPVPDLRMWRGRFDVMEPAYRLAVREYEIDALRWHHVARNPE